MGRYPAWTRKATVEDSHILDASALYHAGILRLEGAASGTWQWGDGGNYSVRPRYSLCYHRVGDSLCLDYSVNERHVSYEVKVRAIPLRWNNGTSRLCLECPNQKCKRRAYKLYLAPGGLYFLCRQCNQLGYETQLQHPGTLCYQLVRMYGRSARSRDKATDGHADTL